MSPVAPYRRPVAVRGNPGESIDPVIERDVQWIRETFKVKVTDGYSTSDVHAANGEHPLGLAIDFIPDEARGGTWDDIDRLMKWAEPQQNQPRHPFRWVGYNGDPNHGKGNHGHLSWKHDGSGRVSTIFGADGKPNKGVSLPGGSDDASNIPSTAQQVAGAIPGAGPVLGPAVGVIEGLGGDAGDLATDVAGKLVGLVVDAIGADGARILLYAGFVIGGAVLAVLGVARAAGLKAPTNAAGLATLVATRNPKAAAAVGAAGGTK